MVSLQYSDVEITIELRPWVELYKILYSQNNIINNYAPDKYNPEHRMINFISNAKKKFMLSENTINMYSYLEANYIYLDDSERQQFAYKPLDYIIDQTTRIQYSTLGENTVIDMVLQNPIKEMVWILKRSDQGVYNNWFDFQDEFSNIMKSAKIMFNGVDRIEEKDAEYYNYLQPFQHHSGAPKEGIYMYSFSIFPEDYQPSGSVNASRINNIQLYLNLNKPKNGNYGYDTNIYVVNYNFLRISSGLAGIVYTS